MNEERVQALRAAANRPTPGPSAALGQGPNQVNDAADGEGTIISSVARAIHSLASYAQERADQVEKLADRLLGPRPSAAAAEAAPPSSCDAEELSRALARIAVTLDRLHDETARLFVL